MTAHLTRRRTRITVAATAVGLLVSGCSLIGSDDTEREQMAEDAPVAGTTVVLATHSSFSMPKKLVKQFEKDTGVTLKVRSSSDAGELTTQLVLNKENPFADVAFGIDNTFASRAIDEDVFAEYAAALPPGAAGLRLEGSAADRLTPVDQASVCVNVDTAWFAENDRAQPTSFDDLADPAWRDLTAIPGATTSSPGLAFLLATIAEYGEGAWQTYWEGLMGNGAKLSQGWTDAYYGDFTGGGEGNRPIVVSYDTSPAFTIDERTGESTTVALLDTCFRQVEYAGVLENAKNPAAAKLVVDFLLSPEVQASLPEQMYVFPVDSRVELPADWAKFAVQPTDPREVTADDIDAHRQEWLTEWTDITTR